MDGAVSNSQSLEELLGSFRSASKTNRESGTYFERLAKAFLTTDPVQAEEYSEVSSWADWAAAHGWNAKDVGIDLVAKLRNEDGYAAIQCKFYEENHRIQKADIDSFISASGKEPFQRRVVIDTTTVPWGVNAEEMITGQTIPVVRLSLTHLRESPIDWTIFGLRGEAVLTEKKSLREHQTEALDAVRSGLSEADRGKLVMACGTGKTFTALKIAEDLVGKGGRVLFMVPSLALMSQTVREWTNDTDTPLRSFAVCSDVQVGKRRVGSDDVAEIDAHDLAFPATTKPDRLVEKAGPDSPDRMTVFFSTYQSIKVLDDAQKAGLPDFDLIICDEAHRTTGATLAGEEDSNFVRIHDDKYVRGRKRLYMTATPRIFGDAVRARADEEAAVLASMDDEELYGKTLLHTGFGWAVQKGLLTDYKVIVLAMDEGLVSANVQRRLADASSELDLDDATKIIGCYKALSKQDLKQDLAFDPRPMRRALAFCKSIAASKLIRDEFSSVVAEYTGDDSLIEDEAPATDNLHVEIEHVDGTFNAKSRNELLDWLKAEAEGKTARILTNARCLSEGVDVPALDAIMFLHPRKSLIDVVQSVGRVMRRAEPDTPARKAFNDFLAELQDDLNDSITEQDAIEMLAQHLITRPVFKALFEGHAFTDENPVSCAMQQVLEVLDENRIDKESKDLTKFYDSVRNRAHGITDPQAKQRLIVELYDKFFRNAFPRTTEKLGIVYTPVEIVDFILHSVNEMLQGHFGQTLGSRGVHIMDPFTGTGTFITRLLQSGLIAPEELEHKYRHEIHANEIVLLAYYIAAINIEAVYQGEVQGEEYVPFEGICLTDTFQMYEGEDELALYMPDNSERRTRQKELDIRVIVGNPPYSVGQGNANDNAANIEYAALDEKIRTTYVARSDGDHARSLYDSYIRALRWASDRISNDGIVAFVTSAGWIDGKAMDGLRRCLSEEFSSIHIFHLRGDQRTSGELSRKEGGKIFGSGSRAPIAISVLVKDSKQSDPCKIKLHDIGDYLDRQKKLAIVRDFQSIEGISRAESWTPIQPNNKADWINQRSDDFDKFLSLGSKKRSDVTLFSAYSSGLETRRDAWSYNFSKEYLGKNMHSMVNFFNSEVDNFKESYGALPQVERERLVGGFISTDHKLIKWSEDLIKSVARGRNKCFRDEAIRCSTYRPFQRMWLYSDDNFIWSKYRLGEIFPPSVENLTIIVTGPGTKGGFSCQMMSEMPCRDAFEKGYCFPLYFYEEQSEEPDGLFEGHSSGLHRRDAITDAGLAYFQAAYPGEAISKEDIFYYVYGLLHSPDYRDLYADNLTKELPRIPAVKAYADFRAFSDAGRRLGDLHVNYETVEPYPVTYKQGTPALWNVGDPEAFYRVTKMKFGGKARDKDKTTVIYNSNITMTDIPLEAYDYVVNGKPALEWVMERQVVKTDKASGIVNDANDYANETMNNPAYPLELFQRVITVSLETMKIVRGLPKMELPE